MGYNVQGEEDFKNQEALENLISMARANQSSSMAKRKRSNSKRRPRKFARKAKGRRTTTARRVKPAQIQKLASKMKSFRDFPVKSNTLTSGGLPDAAIIRTADNGDIVVRHREYIMDIIPTDDFTIQTNLAINPGLESLFPWLSGVASNFENYDLKGLVFEFKSLSSDAVLSASASTSLGTVSMATQYNVLEDPFENKRELLNYQFANSSKPSLSFVHPVECKRNPLDMLWVRTVNTDLTGADRRLYDLGDFILATEGCQGAAAGGAIGELWATIEVVLSKSKLRVTGLSAAWDLDVTTSTNTNPWGTLGTQTAAPGNNIAVTFSAAGDSATLEAGTVGTYMITYLMVGASSAITNNGFEFTNATELNWCNHSGEFKNGGTSASWFAQTVFDITDPTLAVVIEHTAGSAFPGTKSDAHFTIVRLCDRAASYA